MHKYFAIPTNSEIQQNIRVFSEYSLALSTLPAASSVCVMPENIIDTIPNAALPKTVRSIALIMYVCTGFLTSAALGCSACAAVPAV